MKRIVILCCTLLLGLSAATAHTHSYEETREFNLAFSGAVDFETNVGAIVVKSWENDYVLLRARIHANGADESEARLIAALVQIYASDRVWASGPSGRSWAVSFEIFVPRASGLNLTTAVGAITIHDVAGTISARSGVGAVELVRLAGNVEAKTGVGAISVTLSGSRWEGKGLTAATGTGAIKITAPADYSASFDLRTALGGIHTDFPGAQVVSTSFLGKKVAFQAGTGGPEIRATSAVGQVELTVSVPRE